jgi:hypothetical protein
VKSDRDVTGERRCDDMINSEGGVCVDVMSKMILNNVFRSVKSDRNVMN